MNKSSITTERNLEKFSSFGKFSAGTIQKYDTNNVVIYTRVSSKEQADKNLSLETQKKAIEDYAERNKLNIIAYFGGTYESAKSDGRKEFMRMMAYIKKNKGTVNQLLVYSIDRFSRTGGGAIKLASDLRELYGVNVFAVTQPTDTTNPSGVFSQNMQLLVSQYDNELRKLKAVAGMKAKFEKGIWCVKPPIGYDTVKINGERKIVINKYGKLLKKAFDWKGQGLKNEEILKKLKVLGLPLLKQHLCKIFINPFYCGLLSHGMLEGRLVDGIHDAIISKELFLKINNVFTEKSRYGVPHKKEDNNIPLKVFIKCNDCGVPFTGYLVKAKNLYYYKCRQIGCKCNKSAKQMHQLFEELLSTYSVKPVLIPAIERQLAYLYKDLNKESEQNIIVLKTSLTEVNKKLDTIEEKHYVLGEMNKETFQKFYQRYQEEKHSIEQELHKNNGGISNHQECINSVLQFSSKLNEVWTSGDVSTKEKLQKLVFPEGIYYIKQKGAFRTTKVNSVFSCIADLQTLSEKKTKGTNRNENGLSPLVRAEGLEPPCLRH